MLKSFACHPPNFCPLRLCTSDKSDKIELVQKRASRMIYPGLYYNDAFNMAQCPPLDDRRHDLCINTFKKIQEHCSCWHHLSPTTREDSHKYISFETTRVIAFLNVGQIVIRGVLSRLCVTLSILFNLHNFSIVQIMVFNIS